MNHSIFLRRALNIDALISGATGLLLAVGSGWLSGLLGLSTSLLLYAGLFLLPFAALVYWLGRSDSPSRSMVWTVVMINLLWALASVWLVVVSSQITGFGVFFVLFQAAVVAGFGFLQIAGLQRVVLPSRSP